MDLAYFIAREHIILTVMIPLVYADYYFLEALLKKEKLEKEGTAIL